MITKNTVFILGAGASSTYGFPTGNDLTSTITANLRPLKRNQKRLGIDWLIFLQSEFGIPEQEIHAFQSQLNLSKISVDAFLEYRPEFLNVGKLAIALALISAEHENKLFNAKRNWLDYLRLKLDAPFNEFGNNKISFINFNYDRSLEQYLFTVLRNTYGKSDDECSEQINKIPILHVHGRIGALPWQKGKARLYDNQITTESVRLASDQIIVMSEGQKTSPVFQRAFNLLSDAHENRIYFLGFGYHDLNLERLRINEIEKKAKVKPFAYGTSYGLPRSDHVRISGKWGISFPATDVSDVLEFLHEYLRLD